MTATRDAILERMRLNFRSIQCSQTTFLSVQTLLGHWIRAFWLLGAFCGSLGLSACAPPAFQWTDASEPGVKFIQPAPSIPPKRHARLTAPVVDPATLTSIDVWLYVSRASQAQLMTLGTDPTTGVRIWENYLRAKNIRYARITSATDLNRIAASGVLLLASTLVLSEPEKQAVMHWRNRGGSVLSTWLTASHSETGQPLGDAFMSDVLDVRVAGNTQGEEDDTFMIVHGDNPVAHQLPAGTRVWLERVPKQLPLRLIGKQEGAQIMDWSRDYDAQKPSGLLTFNERKMPSGQFSRTVTLGYPEQNWLRSDPKHLDAITGGILSWLWRRPSAYLGAWPHPYESGFLLAVQAAEPVAEVDVDIAKTFRAMGGRATYYVHGGNAGKAAAAIKAVQALGHDIGYFGDRFEGFKDQSETTQNERLDTMQKQLADAGIAIAAPPSFSAPLDSYDQTTQRLVQARKFDNFLAFMEVTDSSLPFVSSRNADGLGETVVLPRTLIGPEETIEQGDPAVGLGNFLKLLDLSAHMGGLSVVRLPAQSLLVPAQRKLVLDKVASLRKRVWMASAKQIAQWWRSREQVSVALEPHPRGYLLSAVVAHPLAAQEPLSIWINLPRPDSRVRLLPLHKGDKLPPVVAVDSLRAAIVLNAPVVGKQAWLLQFEDAAPIGKL